MGESYGGVYVPTLASKIMEGQKDFPINLKGIALGNGYVNKDINLDTVVRLTYGHGFVDEEVWKTLKENCCDGNSNQCKLSNLAENCSQIVSEIYGFIFNGSLNPYDLYRDRDFPPEGIFSFMNRIKLKFQSCAAGNFKVFQGYALGLRS